MKSRRNVLVLLVLLIVALMAFFLQDAIQRFLVMPLAYLWWMIKTYFGVIPQVILWILLMALVVVMLISNLLSWISFGKQYQQVSRPAQGSLATLANWISNPGKGNYYKWVVANRLGKLGIDLDVNLEKRDIPDLPDLVTVTDQLPSELVKRYLKAGLEESFVDYPLPPLPFLRRKVTPFDLDVEQVVKYLESKMEARRGRKHS
jgi:hypothetical protein